MTRMHVMLLIVCAGLAGCAMPEHGPAARTVSTETDTRHTLAGNAEVDRETIEATRYSDAEGREWTESKVVKSERVPLERIDAELFEEAMRASEQRSQ